MSYAEDLIVVDDIEHADESAVRTNNPATPSAHSTRATRRRLSAVHAASAIAMGISSDRTTRASSSRQRGAQPTKLKLKLSDKNGSQISGMSFLGAYDRELDSSEDDLTFEEQFILRMPPGEDCDRLRKAVASRDVGSDVWFKFRDSRRAVFHIGNSTYSSKLVDLPCIVEAQKTLDSKQMFKVADICQMLVVEDKVENEQAMGTSRTFNVDEFIWPHGITPPLHQARKRRFRKRANKRTIESIEQEVERLLEADALAETVQYTVLENVNPDLSDSEFIEREDGGFGAMGSNTDESGNVAPASVDGDDNDEGEGDEDEDQEGDIDEELAAELDLALGDDEGDEDDDEDDDESEEEDDDDEDEEGGQALRLLNEEVRDLQAAISKKEREIASSSNPLIRKRFEDALKKLRADLDLKLEQSEVVKEQRRLQKEQEQDVNAESGAQESAEEGDDLFGPEDTMDLS